MQIKFANSSEEISKCFPIMAELRPHLTIEKFVTQVLRMQQLHNYQLLSIEDNGVKALAGIRIGEWLHTGKYLEIEDLITAAEHRSKGYGEQLFHWIKNYANEMDCNQVRLVSGAHRERAHRFYINQGMVFEAKYFSLPL